MLYAFFKEFRSALRSLCSAPAFTLAVVATLALGIGVNTAVFTVLNAVLIRPLPFRNPESLVSIRDDANSPVAPGNFLVWRNEAHSFEGFAAGLGRTLILPSSGAPERIHAFVVSTNFLTLLGKEPTLGRNFRPEDEAPGHTPVVILSYALWKAAFGGDPTVVGKTVPMNGEAFTIIGVAPPAFDYPAHSQAWITPDRFAPQPIGKMPDPSTMFDAHYLIVIARLNPRITLQQASAELTLIQHRIASSHAEATARVSVTPLQQSFTAHVRPTLLELFGASGFILFIALVNVAHLLLVRVTARKRETAIRMALGASRKRVLQYFITENLVLSVSGGVLGLLLSSATVNALLSMAGELPTLNAVAVDQNVLLFALGASLLVGVGISFVPGWSDSSRAFEALKTAHGDVTPSHRRLRSGLIIGDFSLCLILVVSAALLIQSLEKLEGQDLGFDPHNVAVILQVTPTGQRYTQQNSKNTFFEQLLERIRSLPGVQSASMTDSPPFLGGGFVRFEPPGTTNSNPSRWPTAILHAIGSAYFQTMHIPVRVGRPIGDSDASTASPVVVVNQALVRKYNLKANPVGLTIGRIAGDVVGGDLRNFEIVGVVADAQSLDLHLPPQPEIYASYKQVSSPYMSFLVRTSLPLDSILQSLERVATRLDKDQPLSTVLSMDSVLSTSVTTIRFNSLVLSLFAVFALLLAAVGIYGAMSYVATRREREFGIRMALGARAAEVVVLVLGRALRLTLVGAAVGCLLSLATNRVIASILFGVTALDPITYGVTIIILISVGLLASIAPALRAMRVQPVDALRCE